jgi:hypothetical protein
MTTNMSFAAMRINRLLTDKYLLSNPEWLPFGNLEYDLKFIPAIYHNMFIRTFHMEDPLHDLMLFVSACEAAEAAHYN